MSTIQSDGTCTGAGMQVINWIYVASFLFYINIEHGMEKMKIHEIFLCCLILFFSHAVI